MEKGPEPYNDYLRLSAAQDEQSLDGGKRGFLKCSPITWLLSFFPILSWLPRYSIRDNLTSDLVAGMTIAIMQIPQGMAYAMLANVPPVIGIYMAFFPVLMYSCMGTSRHISIGTFAVTCLMTGKTVTTIMAMQADDLPHGGGETNGNATKYTATEIATIVSLVTGCLQVLMGTLQLGFLCVLLSSDLVSGFTTGAAVHVLTSQVKNLLGLTFPRRNGIGKIPLTYYDIFTHISDSNVTAIIFSAVTLTTLITFNELIKPQIAKRSLFPVPIELIVVVLATLISRYWITSEIYGIPIVKDIPTGFPLPQLPPLPLVKHILLDCCILAIVSYTITISMAKIFAAKHGYEIGANQELAANGASNIVGSFFSCAVVSASLSRSVIQEQVGGKTQVASLFSCLIIVFVLLWIAPFFETLPHCALSALIIVALKGMLIQVTELPRIFQESPLNFMVWAATFLATVFLDIAYGLATGIIFSIILLIYTSNRARITLLSVHSDSDGSILVEQGSPKGRVIAGLKIVKYTGSLNFATFEHFSKRLQSLVPPARVVRAAAAAAAGTLDGSSGSSARLHGIVNHGTILEDEDEVQEVVEEEQQQQQQSTISSEHIHSNNHKDEAIIFDEELEVTWLLLDLSSCSSLDPAATKGLISLQKIYLKKDINILFVGASPPLIKSMDKGGLIRAGGLDHFHPNVPSALHFLKKGLVTRRRSAAIFPPAQRRESVAEMRENDEELYGVGPNVAYFRRLSRTSLY